MTQSPRTFWVTLPATTMVLTAQNAADARQQALAQFAPRLTVELSPCWDAFLHHGVLYRCGLALHHVGVHEGDGQQWPDTSSDRITEAGAGAGDRDGFPRLSSSAPPMPDIPAPRSTTEGAPDARCKQSSRIECVEDCAWFHPPLDITTLCPARQTPFSHHCTRPCRHDGPHVACLQGRHRIEEWSSPPTPPDHRCMSFYQKPGVWRARLRRCLLPILHEGKHLYEAPR